MAKQTPFLTAMVVGGLACLAVNLAFVCPALSVCGDEIIDLGEDCDDGNTFGGDGCAQNCTDETTRMFLLDPNMSGATTQFSLSAVELGMSGSLKFIMGGPSEDGTIPFAVPSKDIIFGRIPVPGVACACVRSLERPDRFGPGNGGIGLLGCGESFLVSEFEIVGDHNIGVVNQCQRGDSAGAACTVDTDCPGGRCFNEARCLKDRGTVEPPAGVHPGVCNGPKLVEFSSGGPRGSMVIETNIGFDLLFDTGTCCDVGIDPGCTDPTGEKGPDGIACSEDDPGATQGLDAPGFTGPSAVSIIDLDNREGVNLGPGSMCGTEPCVAEIEGEVFDCDAILASPTGGLETGVIVFAFQILDYPVFGDALVTVKLVPRAAEDTCLGDCNGDKSATIDELLRGVNIALGTSSVEVCPAFDRDLSGNVTIDELVAGVTNALNGCPVT